MDQGLAVCPREESNDDVYVDDIREGVTTLGKPMDVISQGFAGLLLAAPEVPGVSRANVRPLEIPDEDPLKVCPVADTVVWKEFEPCPNMLPYTNGKILDDEKVIIHSSNSSLDPICNRTDQLYEIK